MLGLGLLNGSRNAVKFHGRLSALNLFLEQIVLKYIMFNVAHDWPCLFFSSSLIAKYFFIIDQQSLSCVANQKNVLQISHYKDDM